MEDLLAFVLCAPIVGLAIWVCLSVKSRAKVTRVFLGGEEMDCKVCGGNVVVLGSLGVTYGKCRNCGLEQEIDLEEDENEQD